MPPGAALPRCSYRECVGALASVLASLDAGRDALPAGRTSQREFLGAYRRTTAAVGAAIEGGFFEDPEWVEAWDVAFAQLYLDALAADAAGGLDVPRPWRLAFDARASLPALRHVLLGMNAHINYDLPQALLAVIPDDDFTDHVLLDLRHRDHMRIDRVVTSRVAAEDDELGTHSARSRLDRVLQPMNRWSARRCLTEARRKVWHNTIELQRARLDGPEAYARRLAELERLSASRIADLLAPGQVLLRLAVVGFGVVLPPASGQAPPGRAAETGNAPAS